MSNWTVRWKSNYSDKIEALKTTDMNEAYQEFNKHQKESHCEKCVLYKDHSAIAEYPKPKDENKTVQK